MTVKVSKPAINVREELADLRKPTGVAGEAMLRAETPQEQFNLIGAGRRNLIINGGFDVWQRGATSTAVNGFDMSSADRWYAVRTQLNQETDTYGNPYAHCVCGNFTDSNYLQYKVEFPRKLLGKTLTLSYWIKSDDGLGQNGGLYIRYYTTSSGYETPVLEAQKFGSEWTRVVRTFTMPTTAVYNDAYGLEIFIQGNTATENNNTKTFDIKEVQLELGKVATPFEHRSYGEELALCQRYYTRLGNDDGGFTHLMVGSAEGTTVYVVSRSLSTRMRAVPTVTVGSGVNGFTASAGVVYLNSFNTRCSRDIACISANVTGTATVGQAAVLYDAGANGYIELDAEL